MRSILITRLIRATRRVFVPTPRSSTPQSEPLGQKWEQFWATQHLRKSEWPQLYWNTQDLPSRDILMRKLQTLWPFSSVLELGCNSGPNLARIYREFGNIRMAGVDINPEAIKFGSDQFEQMGAKNVHLEQRSLYDLACFSDGEFDVVLSSGVLIHIPPTHIELVLTDMLRIAQKHVVMREKHAFLPKYQDEESRQDLWCHDYWPALLKLTTAENINISQLPPLTDVNATGFTEANAILEVHL